MQERLNVYEKMIIRHEQTIYNSRGHPELRKGELFLGNFAKEDFKQIGWKTERAGSVPYDVFGKPINTMSPYSPVFVQIAEIREQLCQILGCHNEAEHIETPLFSSGLYCRKHFDEINEGETKK